LVSLVLVTTALEETWPDTNKPVLFLGEWCRLYSRKAFWEKLDAVVAPYHWDDRDKLHKDYLYLQGLYEDLLVELAAKLNSIHSVNHSLRYWRILIGPWLGCFTQVLFDRWIMIDRAVNNYSISSVNSTDYKLDKMVPNDMEQFNQIIHNDQWNEAIYAELLKKWTRVFVKTLVSNPTPSHHNIFRMKFPWTQSVKLKLKLIISGISRLFTRENELFFHATYLPKMFDFLLQWRFRQVPKFWGYSTPTRRSVDWTKRQWKLVKRDNSIFSEIACAMIPKQIPTLYLEGYFDLQVSCEKLPWPKSPRLIFTSNSFYCDDIFKAWAAGKIEFGAPLVIGQHGGNYGIALWNFMEDHQIAISNAYLTWGWCAKDNIRIKPTINLKSIDSDLCCNPKGGVLLIQMSLPRYSYHMFSTPIASQWLDYFQEQYRFVIALPDYIKSQLLVRLYDNPYGWNEKDRWQACFPDIGLDDGLGSIEPLIEKSRINISTYNATVFLDLLMMNLPTIIFWNPKQWELKDSAIPFFEQLKLVGIFHENPESAVQQLTLVWDDVGSWWNGASLQSARKAFCDSYSRKSTKSLNELEQTMRELLK
jgi:putative transferase (TIGR04331 family)